MGDGSLWVLDCEITKLIPSYPKMTDTAFISGGRLYYVLKRARPNKGDYEAVAKDDGKSEIWFYGPITVTYSLKKKKEAAEAAIYEFIHHRLCLGGEDDPMPLNNFDPDMRKQSFYIVWKKWGAETWEWMQKEFHAHQSTLRVDDFFVVGRRQLDDCVVCLHNKNELEEPWLPDEEEINYAKIKILHITKCLGKTDFITPDMMLPPPHPWRHIEEEKMRRVPDFEQHWHLHPFFSRYVYDNQGKVNYRPGHDWLPLSEEEQDKLPTTYKDIYQAVVKGTVTPNQIDELNAFLRTGVNKLYATYVMFGYDSFEFVMHRNFLVPELLKIFAHPPPPRARPDAVVTLELKNNLNNLLQQARAIPVMLTLCTNKKTKTATAKTKPTLLLLVKRISEKFEAFVKEIPVFVEYSKSVELGDGSSCFVLEGELVIYKFLGAVADRLFYPLESIISHVPEVIDKKDDPRSVCFASSFSSGFVSSLSLASLAIGTSGKNLNSRSSGEAHAKKEEKTKPDKEKEKEKEKMTKSRVKKEP